MTIATDASFTLSHPEHPTHLRHNCALTAHRTVTLSKRGAALGATFIITRAGGGNFLLKADAPALNELKPGAWCEVTLDGTAWHLARSEE